MCGNTGDWTKNQRHYSFFCCNSPPQVIKNTHTHTSPDGRKKRVLMFFSNQHSNRCHQHLCSIAIYFFVIVVAVIVFSSIDGMNEYVIVLDLVAVVW